PAPAAAQPIAQRPVTQTAPPPKIAEIYPGQPGPRRAVGAPQAVAGQAAAPAAQTPGDITLNFEDADIRQVAQAVLRDVLGVNYVIDPDVRGTATIRTARPLNRDQVLPLLQSALQSNGAGLFTQNGIYRVALLQNAGTAGQPVAGTAPTAPGIGGRPLQVFPLRYIGAEEMAKILRGTLPEDRIVHADPGRNVLVVQGSAGELRLAGQTVDIFDVDAMSEQSVLLESLQYADVGTMVFELENLFGGKNGPLTGAVKFIPIERLNAVMVIAKQPRYLDEARQWIARLDRTRNQGSRRLYVYYVQNGKAAAIAGTLRGIFGASRNPSPTTTVQRAAARAGEAPAEGEEVRPSAALTALNSAADGEQGVRIIADEANNAVLVLATPRDYESIEEVLAKLDLMPLQVIIDASIIEVSLNDTLRYGVQYFLSTGDIGIAKHGSSQLTIGTTEGSVAVPLSTSTFGGPVAGGFSFVIGGGNTRAVIDALSNITTINVVSNPQVMVLDNQTAKLQVGDEVPILTRFIDTTLAVDPRTVNSVEYRQTGVTLEVIPRVNVSGLVTLEIAQEVSDVTPPAVGAAIQSPTIRQRRILSSVAIRSGETVALGGLIREQNQVGNSGIPILHEIPVLGSLFGRKINDVARTELLVLITPRVVRNQLEARDATLEMRRKFQAVLALQERGPAPTREPTPP
uniref:type II secretion system secretin GspD n=1 Tax=Desertibaculum subflavum TaxID=2268458 RepID=UPI000E66524A